MTRAIESIKSTTDARYRKIHVKEWGIDLYTKTWTLGDSQRIKALVEKDSPQAFAAIVQLKALDANGEQMFTMQERELLVNHADAQLLQRLAMLIGQPIPPGHSIDNPQAFAEVPTMADLEELERKNLSSIQID